MDRGAWWATVHWVTKSQTGLSTHSTAQVPPDQAFPFLLSQHLQGPHPQATQAHTLVVLPEGQCSEGSWIGENLFIVSSFTSQQGWPSWQPEVMSVVWAAKCGGPLPSFLRKWGSVSISSVSFLLSARTHPHLLVFSQPLLYFFQVKVKVAQSCLTLCDRMDYTVRGILQARILEWVVVPFSRGYSQPRDGIQVAFIAGRFFTSWATREAQEYWSG